MLSTEAAVLFAHSICTVMPIKTASFHGSLKPFRLALLFWISREQGMKADALGVVSFSSTVYTMAGHKVASLS